MTENETERKARIAGEEVRRLEKILDTIRRGELTGTYLNLRNELRVSDYIGRGVSDVEDL